MKGTRKSGWALCLAALAAMLPVLLRADTAETSKKPVVVPFDEAEMERYRVDIQQQTPDIGITSGHVFAYGYYILPPYQVSAKAGTTWVNGVYVWPQRVPGPRSWSYPRNPWLDTDDGRRMLELDSVIGLTVRNATAEYGRSRRDGQSYGQALEAVRTMLVSNPLVESVRVRDRRLGVYGPEYTGPGGGPTVWYRSIDFPDTAYRAPEPKKEPSQTVAEAEAEGLRSILRNGGSVSYHHEGVASRPSGFASKLAGLMTRDDLSASARWEKLKGFCTMAERYAYIANRPSALVTWRALADREGGGQ